MLTKIHCGAPITCDHKSRSGVEIERFFLAISAILAHLTVIAVILLADCCQ